MCALRRSSHAVYDLKYHFVWIAKYGKEIVVGEVAKHTREVFERIGGAYGLMIDTVKVGGTMYTSLLKLPLGTLRGG